MSSAVKLLGVGFLVFQFIVACAPDKESPERSTIRSPAEQQQLYEEDIERAFPCLEGYRNVLDKYLSYQDSFQKDADGNPVRDANGHHVEGAGTSQARDDLSSTMLGFFNPECCDKFYQFVMQQFLERLKYYNKRDSRRRGIDNADGYLFPEDFHEIAPVETRLIFGDVNGI